MKIANHYPLRIAREDAASSNSKAIRRRAIVTHVSKVSGLAVASVIAKLTKLSNGLTASGRKDLNLQTAIETLIDQLTVARPMTISFETGLFYEKGLSQKTKRSILRVIQEQLTNIAKFANASEVYVSLRRTRQRAYLVIRDNGRGFDLFQKRDGFCITDIVECAKMNHAQATIQSEPDKGSWMRAEFSIDLPDGLA